MPARIDESDFVIVSIKANVLLANVVSDEHVEVLLLELLRAVFDDIRRFGSKDDQGLMGLALAQAIEAARSKYGVQEKVEALVIVETPLGLENVFAIASASPLLRGILLGAEDFTAAMGAQRTAEGAEIAYARSRLLTACKAAGVLAIDTPFPFVSDLEGLEKDAAFAVQLGFDGKSLINPRQIELLHNLYAPTRKELAHARLVVEAAEAAAREGRGVVSLNGKMVDSPVIERALLVISRAELSGIREE